MTTDFIIRYEGVFSKKECQDIIKQIDYFEKNNFLCEEGKRHRVDHRATNLVYHYDFPAAGPISELILPRFQPCVDHYLNTYSVLGESRFLIYDCKIKKIPTGAGFHTWHYENCSILESQRYFVIQAYLNDDFEGGETEFLYQNKREKAVAGDVIIFPCSYTHVHRGNPPLGGTKYLATSWGWMQAEKEDMAEIGQS